MKPPFENDIYLARWMKQTIHLHDITTVVETGTETGATASWFSLWVEQVYTCDVQYLLDRELPSNVQYFQSRSDQMLEKIYPNISGRRTLFWLDAHMCPTFCALPYELNVIKAWVHPAGRLIAIHDFKTPEPTELGWDEYDELGPLNLQLVKPYMSEIFPDGYSVSFNTQADGAKRGVALFVSL